MLNEKITMTDHDIKCCKISTLVITAIYIIFATLLFLALTTCSARELSCHVWNTYAALLLSIVVPGIPYLIVMIACINYIVQIGEENAKSRP